MLATNERNSFRFYLGLAKPKFSVDNVTQQVREAL